MWIPIKKLTNHKLINNNLIKKFTKTNNKVIIQKIIRKKIFNEPYKTIILRRNKKVNYKVHKKFKMITMILKRVEMKIVKCSMRVPFAIKKRSLNKDQEISW